MRRLLPSIALVLAACTTIASPDRLSVYQFQLLAIGPTGDTTFLSFHWPRSSLPVRIFVADTSVLRPHVATAIDRWQAAFLYGEYRAVIVTDSTQADVIFENVFPPLLRAGVRLDAGAPQCSGATDGPDLVTHEFVLPIHSYVYTSLSPGAPGLDACYRITVTHEMGHTLGILNHSPFDSDIMYSNPLVDALSNNDRETVETAYHVPANVVLTNRH